MSGLAKYSIRRLLFGFHQPLHRIIQLLLIFKCLAEALGQFNEDHSYSVSELQALLVSSFMKAIA